MDIGEFYGFFSATCFTLVGLWWMVIDKRSDLVRDPERRRDVGGVYLTFLLPGLMGMFAQVGGVDSPTFWRISFPLIALIGAASSVRLALADRRTHGPVRLVRWLLVLLYLVIAVVGMFPALVAWVGVRPIQVEATLLVLLVAMAHALVWHFVARPPVGAGT
ncbi:MAG TPA: hypothetical protein P5193_13935 [Microthrixaceae bacterium]|nr:hypothetical protein [Microthrixaceae bacterium]